MKRSIRQSKKKPTVRTPTKHVRSVHIRRRHAISTASSHPTSAPRKQAKRVFWSIISFVTLCILLMLIMAGIVWQSLPSFLVPNEDSTTLVYFPAPLFVTKESPSIAGPGSSMWLIVTRGSHRQTAVIQLPLTASDQLQSGMVPNLPAGAFVERLQRTPVNDQPQLVSQALGVVVDQVLSSSVPLTSEEILVEQIATQAWQEMVNHHWSGPWIKLFIAMKNADTAILGSPSKLSTILDRIDIALMGDFASCPIAILNATKQNGLASNFATLVEQSGGQVVRTDGATTYASFVSTSDSEASSTTKLFVETGVEQPCSQLERRLSQQLPILTIVTNDQLPQRLRSKAVLVLGEQVIQEGIFTASDQYPQ